MATPISNTLEAIDLPSKSKAVRNYHKYLSALPIIPPSNTVNYSLQSNSYSAGEDKRVSLSERQVNHAKTLAEGKYTGIEAYVIAGYAYNTGFKKISNVPGIKEHIGAKAKKARSNTVMALCNFLRYDGAIELNIDATWLLNEQVNLFEICKQEKKYTQAIRLLHDISYHVDVDARVSNKLEIESSIDYEALLNKASNRIIDVTPSDDVALESIKSTPESIDS